MGDHTVDYVFKTNLTQEQVRDKYSAALIAALEQKDATPETIAAAGKKAVLEIDSGIPADQLALMDDGNKQFGALLMLMKTNGQIEDAKRLLQTMPADAIKVEKPAGGTDMSKLPLGAAAGAAAGFGIAAVADVGDWKSVSGILKKIALIGAVAGVGAIANNDFGSRTAVVNMFSGDKNKGAAI